MEKSENTFETIVPRKRSAPSLILVVLIILVVIIGWRFLASRNKLELFTGTSSDYQAVFLTNNQVYFGKLSNQDSKYPVLTDIYYLRVTQSLQPSQPNPNINLIKLGDELHGPADKMEINRDQILFVEDLKPDSQVVTAIKDYLLANPR